MIKNLNDMLNQLKGQDKVILSVASAEDKEVLIAIKDAVEKEIIKPILVGQAEKICTIAKEINFNLVDIKIINAETIKKVLR